MKSIVTINSKPSQTIMRLILSLLLVFNLTVTANASTNVNGGDLQRCSSDGMALTGFTRNGKCEEYNSDAGSHHVCIDLSSVSSGSSQSENFCTVTGQSDWCSSQMDCNDNSGALCPVQHWCVCQWAFASYIQKAGGCQHIQNIQCDATNINAWKAYQVAASEEGENESKFKDALNCLESRCGLTTSV
mmetsp:Transcript_22144/g.33790  ORF Transcript_22144/g.33790 Transcript_22144/m.33790 type:complete len:188 (+) Transcript_22144:1-564(+)